AGHLGRQRGDDVVEAGAQVAVVVDGIDERLADRAVARRELRQVQLPGQVVVQALGFGQALGGVPFAVAVTAAAASLPGLRGLPFSLRRGGAPVAVGGRFTRDRKSTRLNSSHVKISYAVFC